MSAPEATMLDSQVLVLNRVFQAVQVTSVRKAFSLFYKGHVKAVLPDYTTYEFENWCDIPVQPQDELPPRESGITWSSESSDDGNLCPQYWQRLPSRR